MKEFSNRELFDAFKRFQIEEVKIDTDKHQITVDNRLDLYKLLSFLKLVTFKENGNNQTALDKEGVPLLSFVSDQIKFRNSFEEGSPYQNHPVVVKLEEWTIMGTIGKAIPGPSL